jgi:hypothetical protein
MKFLSISPPSIKKWGTLSPVTAVPFWRVRFLDLVPTDSGDLVIVLTRPDQFFTPAGTTIDNSRG